MLSHQKIRSLSTATVRAYQLISRIPGWRIKRALSETTMGLPAIVEVDSKSQNPDSKDAHVIMSFRMNICLFDTPGSKSR